MVVSLNFENQHIEYKRCLNDRFEPAVIAFLNSSGGILYIGIDDNLTVYGVKNPDVVQRQIADRIKNNIRGECLGLYDIVTENKDGKNIVKVIVSSGPEKPYYLKERGMTPKGCFFRNGSRVENMTRAMIEKTFARRIRNSLTTIISPHQDLTFEQLGTGMKKMLAAYTPNIFELSPNFFHVMLRPEAEKTTEKEGFTTKKEEIFTEKTTEKILRAIKDNPYITTKELALEFDITDDGVFYHIRKLRIAGQIQRAGGRKSGYWEVLK